MWQCPLMWEVLGCFWKSLWTGCAAELPDFFTETGHTTQPFSKEAKYTCNSGYDSEICLQISSLQFVQNDFIDEGLLKVELLSCLLICIVTEGLIMHQYIGTIQVNIQCTVYYLLINLFYLNL